MLLRLLSDLSIIISSRRFLRSGLCMFFFLNLEKQKTFLPSLLDKRVGGGGGDSAAVVLVLEHLDVSVVSPGLAPGVLDQPVVLPALLVGAVSDGQHAVVQLLGVAPGVGVHAVGVELEALPGGIDSDRDGANGGHCLGQGLLIALGHVDEAHVPGALVPLGVAAGIVLSLVRVRLLGVDATVLLDVLEGVVHEAAVATLVAIGLRTVNEVLLAQGRQGASLAEVLSFQGSGLEK